MACEISTPFSGPGYERGRGVAPDVGDTVILALTHAVLDPKKRKPFDRYIGQVADGIEEHSGLVGFSMGKQLFGDEVWTVSVWSDREALSGFVRSDLHRAAMDAGRPAVRAIRTCSLESSPALLPVKRRVAFALLDRHCPWDESQQARLAHQPS